MEKANYISTTEFQDWNPETDFTNFTTVTLSGMITRASDWIDKFLGYSLKVEDITGEKQDAIINSDGDLVIYTRKIPIVSVSQIKLVLGTYDYTLDLESGSGEAKYDIPDPANKIYYPIYELSGSGEGYLDLQKFLSFRSRRIFAKVNYRAGYATIPDAIKDAVNLVAKDIFMRQVNPMNLKSASQGGITMVYADQEAGESDLIKDAMRILQPYRKVW